MSKHRKDKNTLSVEQLTARKLDEKRNRQADEVMVNLNIKKDQHLGISIWRRIRNHIKRGKNVAEITYIMERDEEVGRSRTQEVKRLMIKGRQNDSMASAKELEAASPQQRLASKPPLQNSSPRQPKNKTKHLLKRTTTKVDLWAVARDAALSSEPQKKLTFGAVLPQTLSTKPEIISSYDNANPLKGVNTPVVNIQMYDLPLTKPKVASGKLEGIDQFMEMIPVSDRREFAMFVHKHQASGQMAEQLAAQFLAASKTPLVMNDFAIESEVINNTTAVELAASEFVEMTVDDVSIPKVDKVIEPITTQLREGHELNGGSVERLVRQRDAAVQAEFRALVRRNFGDRCAVSGKRLGGVLEAAHIEGADLGCYNVGNGILLSPTLHKLFDRHLMGINPETLTVHFQGDIEFPEYEGHMITPLIYNLDKVRLAKRWDEYLRCSK